MYTRKIYIRRTNLAESAVETGCSIGVHTREALVHCLVLGELKVRQEHKLTTGKRMTGDFHHLSSTSTTMNQTILKLNCFNSR
jgi:hypothetical protein